MGDGLYRVNVLKILSTGTLNVGTYTNVDKAMHTHDIYIHSVLA